jgi:hypothetical protein
MKQQARRVGQAIVAFGLFGVISVSADTLVLRNGQQIEGRLVSASSSSIEFEASRGRTARYERSDVRRIEIDATDGGSDSRFDNDRGGRDDRFGGGRNNNGSSNDSSGMREREVSVEARQNWTDSGITVRSGQSIRFEATGKVRWGPGRQDGPEGEHGSPRNQNRPIPNRAGAALIGKVGDEAPFFIGTDSAPIRMRSSGTLYLGVNDDFLDDNTGAFRVTVYH